MDIVLLNDVEKLGVSGEIVKVRPGFARNFLIPRGLAALATPARVRAAAETGKQKAKRSERLKAHAETLKAAIESRPLTLTLSVGEDGKPFGAITNHDIAEALTAKGHTLEKHAVQLAEPIKALGAFEVPVRLHADVTATLKLQITKQ
ncbi:MAG: 50S ribosomal protein L9 [Dehalococcoidia bacterium]|nr:50S ribosomal protein L9 [Dehalococcoidia bacterium]